MRWSNETRGASMGTMTRMTTELLEQLSQGKSNDMQARHGITRTHAQVTGPSHTAITPSSRTHQPTQHMLYVYNINFTI